MHKCILNHAAPVNMTLIWPIQHFWVLRAEQDETLVWLLFVYLNLVAY